MCDVHGDGATQHERLGVTIILNSSSTYREMVGSNDSSVAPCDQNIQQGNSTIVYPRAEATGKHYVSLSSLLELFKRVLQVDAFDFVASPLNAFRSFCGSIFDSLT